MHAKLACVGGLALDGNHSVRLMQANGSPQPADAPYQVGQVWDLDYRPSPDIRPPHVEDVLVLRALHVSDQPNLRQFLLDRIQPWRGAPNQTFEELVRPTYHGSGYINDIMGVPGMSVGFWISDRRLSQEIQEGKLYYRYPAERGVRLLKYVGCAPPTGSIPSGALVRLSLARWWRHEGSDLEERCYLQMSGWYL
jgi:hypothetical protein